MGCRFGIRRFVKNRLKNNKNLCLGGGFLLPVVLFAVKVLRDPGTCIPTQIRSCNGQGNSNEQFRATRFIRRHPTCDVKAFYVPNGCVCTRHADSQGTKKIEHNMPDPQKIPRWKPRIPIKISVFPKRKISFSTGILTGIRRKNLQNLNIFEFIVKFVLFAEVEIISQQRPRARNSEPEPAKFAGKFSAEYSHNPRRERYPLRRKVSEKTFCNTEARGNIFAPIGIDLVQQNFFFNRVMSTAWGFQRRGISNLSQHSFAQPVFFRSFLLGFCANRGIVKQRTYGYGSRDFR